MTALQAATAAITLNRVGKPLVVTPLAGEALFTENHKAAASKATRAP